MERGRERENGGGGGKRGKSEGSARCHNVTIYAEAVYYQSVSFHLHFKHSGVNHDMLI